MSIFELWPPSSKAIGSPIKVGRILVNHIRMQSTYAVGLQI